MTMKWEELNATDFPQAVKRAKGVCIVPIGCLEKHGPHLPLGMDTLMARLISERGAALEPAVVFPPQFLTQINEARHQPGTVALDGHFMLELLERVCNEIARNGLTKIILLNCHGGNFPLLDYFVITRLNTRHDYTVYRFWPFGRGEEIQRILGSDNGHGGPMETCITLAARPDLVRSEYVKGPGEQRAGAVMTNMPDVNTSVNWYAKFPDHYGGDGRIGSAEKGEQLLALFAQRLVTVIRAVKKDKATPALLDEFYCRAEQPLKTPQRPQRPKPKRG